ncbi:shikimate kinase AroL [Desulfovibrio sp. OttesenSCG-928-F20]|nr:shikimate kinase AroL [Desulfovibrio sp. OttesenSCG-928-M16]MDL2291009.1 shikimate kinase AroL [Desulfovibrio sp. OttesenSCG-928-F20]
MSGPLIFLVGPRASGKSRAGALAAELLSLPLRDTDAMVKEAAGRDIDTLVREQGWDCFRAHERRALVQAANLGGLVATGGGIVLDRENRDLMRTSGRVFYLAAPLPCLRERLLQNPEAARRPSLTGAPLLDELAAIVAERECLYLDCAHHTIDASLPLEEVAGAIARLVIKNRRLPSPGETP